MLFCTSSPPRKNVIEVVYENKLHYEEFAVVLREIELQ